MAGQPAARLTDNAVHPAPPVLGAGPGSPNVLNGSLLAWRGVPILEAVGPPNKIAKSEATVLIDG